MPAKTEGKVKANQAKTNGGNHPNPVSAEARVQRREYRKWARAQGRGYKMPQIRPGVYDDRYAAVDKMMSGVMVLAKTIAVPREYPAIRVPSFPELKRTAALPFTRTGNFGVTVSDQSVVVCRNPVYPVWVEKTAPVATATSMWIEGTSLGAASAPTMTAVITPEYWTTQGGIGAVNNYVWPIGRDVQGRIWCYCPFTATAGTATGFYPAIWITFGASVTTAKLTLQLEAMTSAGRVTQIEYSHAAFTGTSQELNMLNILNTTSLNGPSWFRLAAISYTDYPGTVDISSIKLGVCTGTSGSSLSTPAALSGTGLTDVSQWPLTLPPEYFNSLEPYLKTRATAVGLLLSNVTSVLNQEGSIRAVRVPVEDFDWTRQPYNSDRFKSANPVEVWSGTLQKGCYSYTLSDAASEEFRSCATDIIYSATYTNSLRRVPAFNLDSFTYVNVIQLQDTNATTVTNMQYVLDNHIEFVTSSALFTLDHSRINLEDYHKAQMVLAEKGVFFENPVHLAAIAQMIASAVRALYPVIRPALMQAAVPAVRWAVGKGQQFIEEHQPPAGAKAGYGGR
jgi:hypothetical protein